jgi:hypothetical protein
MAQYGELLNTFDPLKDQFSTYIDNYFKHPTLTKIKNVNKHSVYMVKTYCLLSNFCRYIIALVPEDDFRVGTKIKLNQLNWVSLQTRTLEDRHDVDSHSYIPKMEGPLAAAINKKSSTDDMTTYYCEDFPIEVHLLHKKKDVQSEYQPKGNIISALETFYTIITFVN